MSENKKVLFKIRGLKHYFPVSGKRNMFVKANDGIDIDIYDGETLGIVGESGCGKSTLGRVLLQLYKRTEGSILYFGKTLEDITPKYIKDITSNLPKHRKKIAELSAELEQKKKMLESDPNDFEKIEAYNLARKQYNLAYFPVVTILGGLLTVNDTASVQKAYSELYSVSKDRLVIRRRVKAVELDIAEAGYVKEAHDKKNPDLADNEVVAMNISKSEISTTVASKKKLDRLEKIKSELEQKLVEADKQVAEKQAVIDALREKYKGDPNFAKEEKHRSEGIDLALLTVDEMRLLRSDMQIIFQDPYSSLNPRMTVGQIIGEGLRAHRFFKKNSERQHDYIVKVMEECGLAPYMLHRFPNQFSGGQRQRIGIARALAVSPDFVVCDEAVSALDVSIQSQIINLLQDLREKSNLTYMFISHDMSVIKYISDRIGVMYLGSFVELCSAEKLFEKPMHPYTVALLEAIPTTDVDGEKKEMKILEGDIPSPVNPPPGCKFHTRCQYASDMCKEVEPLLEEVEPEHFVACHHRLNADE